MLSLVREDGSIVMNGQVARALANLDLAKELVALDTQSAMLAVLAAIGDGTSDLSEMISKLNLTASTL